MNSFWNMKNVEKKCCTHMCVCMHAAAVLKFESEVWLFLHCCVDSLSHFMNERCDMLDMIAPSFLFYFIYFSSTTATESLATDSTQAATANHCLQFCSSICLENQTKFGQVTHKKSNLCVIHCSYWSGKQEEERELIQLKQLNSYSYSAIRCIQ